MFISLSYSVSSIYPSSWSELALDSQIPVNVATNNATNPTEVDDAMVVDSTVIGIEAMPPKPIDGATEEIPFIPASQRLKSTLDTTEIDNAIVVVGQRQKKRKRDKAATTSTADSQPGTPNTKSSSSKKAKKEKEREQANEEDGEEGEEGEVVEMEPFDYAGAKNILDDEPEAREESRKDKKKKQKRNNKGAPSAIEDCVFYVLLILFVTCFRFNREWRAGVWQFPGATEG